MSNFKNTYTSSNFKNSSTNDSSSSSSSSFKSTNTPSSFKSEENSNRFSSLTNNPSQFKETYQPSTLKTDIVTFEPNNIDYFPARAPIPSNLFIGINSSKIRHSNYIITTSSSQIKISSANIVRLNERFKSSSDILTYLREHEDFARLQLKGDTLGAVVCAILSGIILTGGVALVVVTGGTATAPLTSLAITFMIGTGVKGTMSSLNGLVNGNFSVGEFLKDGLVNAGLTLITFGAGALAGNLVGIAVQGSNLTEGAVKAIAFVAGGLAGSTVRTGIYVIRTSVNGKTVQLVELIMQGVSGFIEGGTAGYLVVKAKLISGDLILGTGNQPATEVVLESSSSSSSSGTQETISVEKLKSFYETTPDEFNEIISNSRYCVISYVHSEANQMNIVLMYGYQRGIDDGGSGFIHILSRHYDIFEKLGLGNCDLANNMTHETINKLGNDFLNLLKSPIFGYDKKGNPIWEILTNDGVKYLKVAFGDNEYSNDVAINFLQSNMMHRRGIPYFVQQANLIRAKDVYVKV